MMAFVSFSWDDRAERGERGESSDGRGASGVGPQALLRVQLVDALHVCGEPEFEEAEQLDPEPAVSSVERPDVSLQSGEQVPMYDLVRVQFRVPGPGHVGFLGFEMPKRGFYQLLQELGQLCLWGSVRVALGQQIHDAYQLLVLLVDLIELERVFFRTPTRELIHSLRVPLSFARDARIPRRQPRSRAHDV
jgi:hypothetical protein